MAKTAEELNALKAKISELIEKLKELDKEELDQVTDGLVDQIKALKKSEVSLNYEEDTIPVSEKDISTGLRNY